MNESWVGQANDIWAPRQSAVNRREFIMLNNT